jgi:type IV pilus assembly protein PilP
MTMLCMPSRLACLIAVMMMAPAIYGCDDSGVSTPQPSNPKPAPKASPPKPKPRPKKQPPEAEKAEEEEGEGQLKLVEHDFIEAESNRDPFRSFLEQFAQPTKRVVKQQRKVILPRYGLDELKLIAVVTGGARPRAMFRDPSGLGVTVKRGDYLSKNASKIKQILSDKVIVQITEQTEDLKTQIDRVIDLYPEDERQKTEEMMEIER